MILHNLYIKNFKCFSGEHEFNFSNFKAGVHLITGDNQVEKRLGANGAGKSSFLDSLSFCFFGKTMRGLRARNLLSWKVTSGCEVSCLLDINNETARITRTWGPNSLFLEVGGKSKEVTQSDLEEFMGLTFSGFCNSIVIGQFNPMFFDLSATEKLNLFSDVLDLDVWLEKSKGASRKVKEFERLLFQEEKNLANIEGKLEVVEIEIGGTKGQAKAFEVEVESRIKEIESDIEEMVEEKREIKLDLVEKEDSFAEDDELLEDIVQELEELNCNMSELKDGLHGLELEESVPQVEKNSVDRELKKISTIKDICPFCNQKVGRGHIQKEKAKLSLRSDKLGESLKEYRIRISKKRKKINKIKGLIQEMEAALKETERVVSKASVSVSGFQAQLNKIGYDIDFKTKMALAESARPNPYLLSLESLLEQEKILGENKTNTNKKISRLTAKKYLHDFWVKGFKRVRLFMIEETLTLLEAEVNNNLIQLGLAGWEVSFDIERETTVGGVSKGFHVFVHSPEMEEEVPFEAWSGGESQRLKLAGALGLSNLILDRCGLETNVLFIDEGTAHLNDDGINDFMSLLRTQAEQLDKQIWVIDHRSLSWGDFVSQVTIVKDETGANFVYS